MGSSADKVKITPAVQQKAAASSFFRKGVAEPFFGGKEHAFFNARVQPELTVSSPGDPHEKEADRTAEQVMRMPQAPVVSPVSARDEKIERKEEELELKPDTANTALIQCKEETEESLDSKSMAAGHTGRQSQFARRSQDTEEAAIEHPISQKNISLYRLDIMRESGRGPPPGSPSFEQALASSKGAGTAMPSGTRQFMETRFGADFTGVRIHTGVVAEGMNRSLEAQAFAHCSDIYFNSGKYSPDTAGGRSLLAHELTHTIQQGEGIKKQQSPLLQKKQSEKPATPAASVGPVAASTEVVDISKGTFNPSDKLKEEIETAKDHKLNVNISAGAMGGRAVAEISGRKGSFRTTRDVPVPLNIPYLSGAAPTLHLKIANNEVKGRVGTPKRDNDLPAWVEKNSETLGWAGIKLPSLGTSFTNEFSGGALKLAIHDVKVKVGGFADAQLNAGFDNLQKPIINVTAMVRAKGIADAALNINNEKGPLAGAAAVAVNFGSFSGNVQVVYKPDGTIDIAGTVNYNANRLSGSLTLVATDKKTADNFARDQVKGVDPAQASLPPAVPAPDTKSKDRALAGMGTLAFNLTDWFAGTVTVIVDGKGDVTVLGRIAPPKEIKLFEQKDYIKPLFKFEPRASYGIPVVGDIFVFANVSLSAIAKVGPGKIYNIVVEGTYSTDPDIARSISLSGSLNISAYAGLRLRAEGGAGIDIMEHDFKIGVGVNADAGVKGYVDARPTIGYRDPGEFFFKGHMEIAAQPVLGLSGDFFIAMETPWWSPLSDEKWTWPIGSLEYPLPGEFGIGADVEYVLGSGKVPEISFSPAQFDGAKFMTDLVDDHVSKKAGGDKGDKQGKFVDAGAPGATPRQADTKPPEAASKKEVPAKGGVKQKGKQGKDADKNDDVKRMKAAMAKVKELESHKPMTIDEIAAAVGKIKSDYNVPVTFKEQGSDLWLVSIDVKGKGSKQPAKVKAIRKPGDEREKAQVPNTPAAHEALAKSAMKELKEIPVHTTKADEALSQKKAAAKNIEDTYTAKLQSPLRMTITLLEVSHTDNAEQASARILIAPNDTVVEEVLLIDIGNNQSTKVQVGTGLRRKTRLETGKIDWSHGVVKEFTNDKSLGKVAKVEFKRDIQGQGQSSGGISIVQVSQLETDLKTNPANLRYAGYAIETDEEHSLYEPKNAVSLVASPGTLKIKYKTHANAEFTVTVNTASGDHEVRGENLQLKNWAGVSGRGVTQTPAGFILGLNLNRAHLIPDRFMGSGFVSGYNLITTSAEYNQVDMDTAEESLVRQIVTFSPASFDLNVRASLETLSQQAVKDAVIASVPPSDQPSVEANVTAFAARFAGFKICMAVSYSGLMRKAPNQTRSLTAGPLGPDRYLK